LPHKPNNKKKNLLHVTMDQTTVSWSSGGSNKCLTRGSHAVTITTLHSCNDAQSRASDVQRDSSLDCRTGFGHMRHFRTCHLTNKQTKRTPRYIVLFKKLISARLIKTFLKLGMFITVLTRAYYSPLSWARCIPSTPSYFVFKIYFNIVTLIHARVF
jgi:hypothetical protein